MEETTGSTRLDSSGFNRSLTDFDGDVQQVTGKIYEAGDQFAARLAPAQYDFSSNPQLLRSDTAFRIPAEGLTLAVWYKSTTALSSVDITSYLMFTDGTSNFDYAIFHTFFNDPAILRFLVNDSSSGSTDVSTDALSAGWHLIVFWYDPADKKAHGQVDNGTVFDAPSALTNGPRLNGTSLGLGIDIVPPASWDFDDLGFFRGVMSSDQRSRLWNGGAGTELYP